MEHLIGNEALMRRVLATVRSGKMPHSFLICGPEGSGKKTLARLLCAAMECRSEEPPCGVCEQCRKVLSGIHPDVITVDDPEKKTVSVDMARGAKSDLYIRPNEGARKIYIFPRAQDMNPAAQNALLKVMEEPPEYGVFLLLTDRAERLLPTVRSRCVELQMSPVPYEAAMQWLREKKSGISEETLAAAYRRSGGFLGQAEKLLEKAAASDAQAEAMLLAYASGDRFGLLQALWKLENYKPDDHRRDNLRAALLQAQSLLGDALTAKTGMPAVAETAQKLSGARSAADLLQAYRDVQEMLSAMESNVNLGHICGCLAARLR